MKSGLLTFKSQTIYLRKSSSLQQEQEQLTVEKVFVGGQT